MCTVLVGTLNLYLLACGNTLILANHSRATELSNLKNKGSTETLYYDTTTSIPRDTTVVAGESTTVGSEISVTTRLQEYLSYTTTPRPNLRNPNASQTSPNNESQLTNKSNPEALYNASSDIYSNQKIQPQDFTAIWIGLSCLTFVVIIISTVLVRLRCKEQKESVIPEEAPPIDREAKRIMQNRNSWANTVTKMQFQPPPPPESARMQIKELSQPGGLEKLKKLRETKRATVGNERLRKQMQKLREKTINLESTN